MDERKRQGLIKELTTLRRTYKDLLKAHHDLANDMQALMGVDADHMNERNKALAELTELKRKVLIDSRNHLDIYTHFLKEREKTDALTQALVLMMAEKDKERSRRLNFEEQYHKEYRRVEGEMAQDKPQAGK